MSTQPMTKVPTLDAMNVAGAYEGAVPLRTRASMPKALTEEIKQSEHPKKRPPLSMSMIEGRFRNIYRQFYKETYLPPTTLDWKTKELIAIGVSLVGKCEGCLEGHLKKAVKMGLTKEEISDAIVIAIGVAAAGVVDMSDRVAIRLDLHHFE
jgi:AhpD family alkylhydroperoxidase